jgi:hypothetical protein
MDDRGTREQGRLLATDFPGPEDAEHVLAFNARGTRLAAGCDREADHVLVFDPRSGEEVARLEDLPAVSSLVFHAPEVLLVGQQQHMKKGRHRPGRCVRCDLRRGSREVVLEEDSRCAVAVSPNGRVAAVGYNAGPGRNAGLALYETARWQVRHRLTTLLGYGGAWHTVFSGGARYIATALFGDGGCGDLIAVWDARDGRRQRTIEAAQGARPLAFREDTLTLTVGGSSPELLLYKEDEGEDPSAVYQIEGFPTAVRFQGETLAVILHEGGLLFLHAETGRVRRRLAPPAEVRHATPNADWSLFAGTAAGGIFVWKGA